uniref:Uncharacterized protein n=1 Tax=Panagrolaimus davidi TaxID=227884 RepID=A0A914P5T5_9BILA
MLSYLEPHYILTTSDRKFYEQGQKEYEKYQQNFDSNFTVNGFLMNAGFQCSDLLQICTFGGQIFDCCKYTHYILTDLGKCLRMELETAAEEENWLKKQYESGINNGLQVIADVRQDEEMDYFEINDEISDILRMSFRKNGGGGI